MLGKMEVTWAFDWHCKHSPWMTLNCPSSRTLKLQVKYFENGDRCDDMVNESRIGNHPWAIGWHHDLWPWMTSNRPRSRSRNFGIKYLENGERYDVGLKGGQIGNHPWAFDWHHYRWPWMTLTPPSSKVIKITRQIFRKRWQIQRWGQWKLNRKPPMGYRLAPWPLTLDDLEPT